MNIRNCIAAVEAADGGWRVWGVLLATLLLDGAAGFLSRVGVSRTAAADVRKLEFLTGAGVRGQLLTMTWNKRKVGILNC